MKLGLFIGRLNPPHIWHIETIKKALSENDKVLVLLWISKNINWNNPLNFPTRKELIELVFNNETNLDIFEIVDNESDENWVQNINDLIKLNYIDCKNIIFYWGDFKNDSAFKVLKQYENKLNNYKINYIEKSRIWSTIKYKWKEYNISATNLRNALNHWNFELAEKFCNKEIFGKVKNFISNEF